MRSTFTSLFTLALAMLCSTALFAAPRTGKAELKSVPLLFIENKGQVTDQEYNLRPDIDFQIKAAALTIFIGNGVIHYQFCKDNNPNRLSIGDISKRHKQPVASIYAMERMDVELVGANKNARISTEQKQAYYENYFTTFSKSKTVSASTFSKITYTNIYPNIDWVLKTGSGHLEYEFAVRPGGKVSDIKLKYGGTKSLQVNDDGSLTATISQGMITEHAPETFQEDGKKVSTSFILQNNVLSYAVDTYNGAIVIDPTLIWATYSGGSGDDFALGLAADDSENVFVTGWTSSTSAIATSGAYQSTFSGGPFDAFLTKYNSSGMPQWATYYGGGGYDVGLGVTTGHFGDIYMTGCTNSTSAVATPGTYQPVEGGSYDAFLAKFNSAGAIQWATYYGGNDWEEGLAVKTDTFGNIYMTGETKSPSGIATVGAYQALWGGYWDAFLTKFNSMGVMQWSTYIGGTEEDIGYGLAIDQSANVYVAGYTGSSSGIAAPGAFQAAYGGGMFDAFLLKADSAGVVQWATYFGGSDEDQGFSVATDLPGNVYLGGSTASTSAIATPGAHQTVYGGGTSDGLVAKFANSGALKWATYYGGNGVDICFAVAADSFGNVYATGGANSSSAIATPGSYQVSLAGDFDVFLANFDTVGARKWASYYGGNSLDVAVGVIACGMGNVYLAGYTNSASGIATPGAFQVTFGGDVHDAFLAKFNFCALPAVAPITGLVTVCPGYAITLADTTTGGAWSSGNTAIATATAGMYWVSAGPVIIAIRLVIIAVIQW